MRTVAELLRAADPIRYEPMWSPRDRLTVEQRVLARVDERPARLWSRRSMIGAVASLVLLAAAVASRSAAPALQAAAVRFEVRLAEESPAPGLEPVDLPMGRTVYVHPQPVVSNADIARAQAVSVPGTSAFHVEIVFNTQGADKMARATRDHVGRPVAILVDGKVVAVPVVRSAIRDRASITGGFTRDEAQRIADGVIGQ